MMFAGQVERHQSNSDDGDRDGCVLKFLKTRVAGSDPTMGINCCGSSSSGAPGARVAAPAISTCAPCGSDQGSANSDIDSVLWNTDLNLVHMALF
jgi:hypothetical protein